MFPRRPWEREDEHPWPVATTGVDELMRERAQAKELAIPRNDTQGVVLCPSRLTRRDFLKTGAVAALGTALPGVDVRSAGGNVNCIFLLLVGGPSQLDTFDMKPDAPVEVRGPFRPIRTNNPDIQISEIFPRLAGHADTYSIIRTLHHEAASVHDTGYQMMQTGRAFRNGPECPHAGCVLSYLRGARKGMPPHVLLPGPISNTGAGMSHGQSAGFLGEAHEPFVPLTFSLEKEKVGKEKPLACCARGSLRQDALNMWSHAQRALDSSLLLSSFPRRKKKAFDLSWEPEVLRRAYGENRFGQSCLLARRLVERGVRFVTVNMFGRVFDERTWDAHGSRPFCSIERYRDRAGPMLDRGLSSLLEDLKQRGLLDTTLVVATGEFGRTPKINPAGGRDHWPHAWSMLMAGGGIQGGRVVGKTDALGAYPVDRPVTPAEVVATMYRVLGIDPETKLPGPGTQPYPLLARRTNPIMELI